MPSWKVERQQTARGYQYICTSREKVKTSVLLSPFKMSVTELESAAHLRLLLAPLELRKDEPEIKYDEPTTSRSSCPQRASRTTTRSNSSWQQAKDVLDPEMSPLSILAALCLVAPVESWSASHSDTDRSCHRIEVPLCNGKDAKYNRAVLPNYVGQSQQSAIRRFTEQKKLQDLIATNCSNELVFLLCAALLPICIDMQPPPDVPPCRKVCQRVYNSCISSMQKLNFSWPSDLNCSDLPQHENAMCVDPSNFVTEEPRTVRLRGHCQQRCWVKRNSSDWKKKLGGSNFIVRARLVSKKKDSLSFLVAKHFGRDFKNKNKSRTNTYISIRNGRHSKNLPLVKKYYLVLAKKRKDKKSLRIFTITEWRKNIREHFKNKNRNKRPGNRKG